MDIELTRKYVTTNVLAHLITDPTGKVSLGKLENVKILKVKAFWQRSGNNNTFE